MRCDRKASILRIPLLLPLCSPAVLVFSQASNAFGSDSTASGLEQQLQALLAQKTQRSSDPGFLVHLANFYLDLGDDAYSEGSKRRAAYEEGARIARKAINLQEQNAQAHYLYAANLGSAAQLKGVWLPP
jgi:hypothetical protein